MFSRFLSAKKLADVDMNVASIKEVNVWKIQAQRPVFRYFQLNQ